MALSDIRLIIGLGNPGPHYATSWHNAGFMLLDLIAKESNAKWQGWKKSAEYLKLHLEDKDVFLLKPLEYMNKSGKSSADFCRFYKIKPAEILVCYDDICLELGNIRIRKKGTAGGHRGVEDIISQLGTNEFPRLKIGIGPLPENIPCKNYVLSKIPKAKQQLFSLTLEKSVKAVLTAAQENLDTAMNEFNGSTK